MRSIIAILAFSIAGAARAGPDEEARELFRAGVAAYQAGRFIPAAQAFLEAHALIEKPQLLFSAAQAFRRAFDADRNGAHLSLAVRYYQLYVERVNDGGRRLDAARALAELRPLLNEGEHSAEIRFPTRVSVTTPVAGAVASIDGGPFRELPLNEEIAPGAHRVSVRANGYFDQAIEFVAAQGRTAPVDVSLRGVPPKMKITGPGGSEVQVDGKVIGELPPREPFVIDPGRHFVVVSKTGHEPHGEEVDLAYGAEAALEVELEVTEQRKLSWVVLGVGGAAMLTAGALGGVALAAEVSAKDIEAARDDGVISEADRTRHNRAVDRRNTFRAAAAGTAGAGAAVLLSGILLYVFDDPRIHGPASRELEPPPDRRDPPDVELYGVIGPDGAALGIAGRF